MTYLFKKIKKIPLNPPLVLSLGFAFLIILGTGLLSLSSVTNSGESVGFVNAFFTASSASCVTGLTTLPTNETWNLLGKIIILFLIQCGGLGIMTLATVIPLVLQRKIGITSRILISEELNLETFSGVINLLKYILRLSLLVELIGAVILSIRFIPDYGVIKGIWFSIFHSVSAFCNAGFDITGDSMFMYRGNGLINITIMALVVLGGIGFIVIDESLRKKKFKKLSVNSKIVIVMSIFLIFFGALFFYLLEYNNLATLGRESEATKISISFFHSVVARTAGFYSTDVTNLRDSTTFLLMILMFIGASPGSTGGGLKTTTFGVLIFTVISYIRGEEQAVVFNKAIPNRIIVKSLTIIILSLTLIFFVSFILTITEDQAFIDIMFETISAYGTVGSSRGITPALSDAGKIIIALMMYAGRVGPLTIAFSIGKKRTKTKLTYPKANISVG